MHEKQDYMAKTMTSKNERKYVGIRLRNLAESQGWTWKEMEEHLGATKSAIHSYESGQSLPPTKVALRYAALFDMPLNKIFGEFLADKYKKRSESIDYLYTEKKRKNIPIGAMNLKLDRKSASLRLEDLAMITKFKTEDVGSKISLISRMENGIHNISYEHAVTLANALGTKPSRYAAEKVVEKHHPRCACQKSTDNHNLPTEILIALEGALSLLNEREKEIIDLKYRKEMELEEIGEDQNVAIQRISLLEQKAIEKLKRYFESKGYNIQRKHKISEKEVGKWYLWGLLQKTKSLSNNNRAKIMNTLWLADPIEPSTFRSYASIHKEEIEQAYDSIHKNHPRLAKNESSKNLSMKVARIAYLRKKDKEHQDK